MIKMKTQRYQKNLNRRDTRIGLGRIKACVTGNICKNTPNNSAIWNSTRHKDFGKKIRYFLWMLIHEGYKCGQYWERMENPDLQNRAVCRHCGVTESMEHILLECQAPGQDEVWNLLENVWPTTAKPFTKPDLGTLMGCGLADFRDEDGKKLTGMSRMYRILISESAYLIWKIRNERVINGNEPLSTANIRNRWRWTIESRIKTDYLLTSAKFGNRKLPKKTVRKCWEGLIGKEESDSLLDNPLSTTGVLVGIRDGNGAG